MERATEPHLIEQAENILKEYRDRLSYDSISLFKEDGTLLYSTDAFITQQDNSTPFFETLDTITYAFVIGVPRTIIFQIHEKCLVIKPIFVEDYGVVDAWIFALGSQRILQCEEILNELITQVKRQMKKDISETLESERIKAILQRSIDIPKILGLEFVQEDGVSVTLDGDDGIVTHSYGEVSWGIETKGGRKYPAAIAGLEEMDMTIQMDIPSGVLVVEPIYKPSLERNHSKSNRLLLIILLYSVILTTLDLQITPGIVLADFMFLFFILNSRRGPIRREWICPCYLLLVGGLVTLGSIVYLFSQINMTYLITLLLGSYFLLMGAVYILNEREQGRFGGSLPNRV